MLDHDDLLERTVKDRLVAIIRLRHEAPLARVAEALVAGGVRALEFTLTSPGAVPAITACRARFRDDVIVGAGTVLDAEEARRCLDAGAQFLVSPGFDPAVVAMARACGALALPGALTPTEIVTAWRAGADVVKVFPARATSPISWRRCRMSGSCLPGAWTRRTWPLICARAPSASRSAGGWSPRTPLGVPTGMR